MFLSKYLYEKNISNKWEYYLIPYLIFLISFNILELTILFFCDGKTSLGKLCFSRKAKIRFRTKLAII